MKIKLGQCRCGALVYLVEEAGLSWTADMTPLEADGALSALLGGRELYRVTYVGSTPSRLSTAKPAVLQALRGEPGDRPVVVPNHPCPTGAVRALLPASQGVGGTGAPKGPHSPSVAPSRPFSGASRSSATVPTAVQPRTEPPEDPRCDECGLVMKPGEYVAVSIGEVYVWASHLENCGKAG